MRHAGVVAVVTAIVGVLVIGGAVVGVAVHVAHHEDTQHQRERQRENESRRTVEVKFVQSLEAAAKIVIGSERQGCYRSASNLRQSLNTWYWVTKADFEAGTNPETTPAARRIRLQEAIHLDQEQTQVAHRLDYHYATGKLKSSHWRAVARSARFSCAKAFPLP